MKFAIVGAVVTLGWLGFVSSTRADEENIPLKEVPKAVLDAVQGKFPRAELTGAEKETEEGKTVFEIALTHEGQKIEVSVTAGGKITEIETEVAAGDLPGAVRKAIEDKYPKSSIKKAEKVIESEDADDDDDDKDEDDDDEDEGEEVSFEVVVMTADGKTIELEVSPKGKIEQEDDDEDDDDK